MTLLALAAAGLWTQVQIDPPPERAVDDSVGQARGTSSAGAMAVGVQQPLEGTIEVEAGSASLQGAEDRLRMRSAPPSADLASADADAELRMLRAARAM